MTRGEARKRFAALIARQAETRSPAATLLAHYLLLGSVLHSMSVFLPHEKKFFSLFEELADTAVEAAQLMLDLSADAQPEGSLSLSHDARRSNLMEVRERLKIIEQEGDAIVHQIIQGLFHDHTRVTEEKGDIRYFAHNLDNVIDGVEKAVARLAFTPHPSIPEPVSEFAPIILKTANEIKKAVCCLRSIRRSEVTLEECCIRINELENIADRVNRKWVKRLMTTPTESSNEVLERLLIKEIVDILEDTMDNCEDVANILETFRLKGGI
ncbi:MAG TPA: DUF47 family protein [Methanomicrobia archaeon]|nr:DUF47 family protein [Methanomicrobia archaeon]